MFLPIIGILEILPHPYHPLQVATKCIRVSSTATNKAVIETLIEKFRPDMKMLEVRPGWDSMSGAVVGPQFLNDQQKKLKCGLT